MVTVEKNLEIVQCLGKGWYMPCIVMEYNIKRFASQDIKNFILKLKKYPQVFERERL